MSGRVKFTDSFLNQSYNILERLENLNENDVWIHELRLAALLGLTRTTEHGLHSLLQALLAELKSTKRKIAGEKVIKINKDKTSTKSIFTSKPLESSPFLRRFYSPTTNHTLP